MKKLLVLLSALGTMFLLSTCAFAPKEAVPDYLGMLLDAAVTGNREAGLQAAQARNEYLDAVHSQEPRVDFDELMLLSRLIEAEVGETRFSDQVRLWVGEIALNRVASPEFPDTLEEVVFQPGQFRSASQPEFRDGLLPRRASVRAALCLLLGQRQLAPQVLYQANYRLGPVYTQFYDSSENQVLYFCESVNRSLYEGA